MVIEGQNSFLKYHVHATCREILSFDHVLKNYHLFTPSFGDLLSRRVKNLIQHFNELVSSSRGLNCHKYKNRIK